MVYGGLLMGLFSQLHALQLIKKTSILGRKAYRGIKYQGIVTPDGLIRFIWTGLWNYGRSLRVELSNIYELYLRLPRMVLLRGIVEVIQHSIYTVIQPIH
ncbi:hypothetical protein L211DRAFT_217139 [Terfezia boudieri ATCC MYA-4762]|uniref:Uncharacterized protein n=1 Tax=Terfezia boudieri ATCC MYA-4762 TaxID=1051890 RepID=A0A3N4LR44_9PEZI|nr:hypothetical protein L211DRAFT_217139 [Terfezia boudieri ATCC MYA-4762]